ncbi:hypothetical protein FJR11_19950 [Anabaena sp. UHCC 0187]|uniref:hypothetical protein n=1 Tax=Anabaena sp. UHCC 0187 TaxID=2590018 RepID=UPI001444DB69|nr:hypothetical protein [Anabaena sp. UHCC 0187]MTJ14807.1 hypothetical protein [Anabaena sp. UHCC 0187]
MSNLFTAVSVEQQEIVAGGRRNRPARPIVVVESPKITNIFALQIGGNFATIGGRGRVDQLLGQEQEINVS